MPVCVHRCSVCWSRFAELCISLRGARADGVERGRYALWLRSLSSRAVERFRRSTTLAVREAEQRYANFSEAERWRGRRRRDFLFRRRLVPGLGGRRVDRSAKLGWHRCCWFQKAEWSRASAAASSALHWLLCASPKLRMRNPREIDVGSQMHAERTAERHLPHLVHCEVCGRRNGRSSIDGARRVLRKRLSVRTSLIQRASVHQSMRHFHCE